METSGQHSASSRKADDLAQALGGQTEETKDDLDAALRRRHSSETEEASSTQEEEPWDPSGSSSIQELKERLGDDSSEGDEIEEDPEDSSTVRDIMALMEDDTPPVEDAVEDAVEDEDSSTVMELKALLAEDMPQDETAQPSAVSVEGSEEEAPTRPIPGHVKKLALRLESADLLSETQCTVLLEAFERDDRRLEEILMELEYLEEDDLLRFFMEKRKIPPIHLFNQNPPDDVLSLISGDLAIKLRLMPFDRMGQILSIAMANPMDQDAIDEVRKQSGMKVRAFVCPWPELQTAIETNYTR